MKTGRGLVGFIIGLVCLLGLPAPGFGQSADPVTVSVKAARTQVIPGDQLAIAVVLDHAEGWHVHTNEPVLTPGMIKAGFSPIATEIKVDAGQSAKVWPVQWPKPHEIRTSLIAADEAYSVFEGRAVAYVPIQIGSSVQPGSDLSIKLKIVYTACNDRTCQERVDLEEAVVLRVVDPSRAVAQPADPDFRGFDATAFASAVTSKVKFSAFGWNFEIDPAGVGFLLLLVVAAFGGLLLNFTPCVLPVVPLKIMGLSQAAGNPARCFLLGAVMSLGVVVFWVAIGAAIAFISGFTAINSLFQTPWFSLGVGAFILVMAVGMLGGFAVRLPQAVYMINPSHETAGGSFLFGFMTAILSTPCTAPFMGSAAAWAATQPSYITLTTFGAIGFGMALPYLVLSAFPSLLSWMPRTGPASELIKQVMGLLLIAVAVFFLGTGLDPLFRAPVDPAIRFFWWIIAAIVTGAMVWLVVRTFQITRRTIPRVVWSTFAIVFAGTSILMARIVTDRGPIPWIGYTPDRLAEHLSKKKTVVLDFTAEWCINCKALEAGVLHRAEIVKLLLGPDVVPMRVDLTGNNVPGKAKLKELNWLGIPLLAVYGPGVTEPIMYDAYTVDMVKDAISRASGGLAGAGSASPTEVAIESPPQAPPPVR